MARSNYKFSFPKRVRYAEIDAQNILFNSRYLEYFDIGVTEYWRSSGVYALFAQGGMPEFHVAKATVEYRRAIRNDELIDICVRCARVGRSSMQFLFELHGADAEDLRAQGEVISVHVGAAGGAPAPVPRGMIDLFEAYEGRVLQQERVTA